MIGSDGFDGRSRRVADVADRRGFATRPLGAGVARTTLGLLLAIGVVATGTSLVAEAAHRRTYDPRRTLERRAEDAQVARCLAPWCKPYATREYVMVMWLGGSALLDAGDYSGAVEALRVAYRSDVGDSELLALFQRAQEVEAIATNRKAHLQHGHEGPGSSLRPQDVER